MSRWLDIGVSFVCLAGASPVIAALAIAVKLESRGPAFFVQTRVGRGKRPFELRKLRTMVVDGEGPAVTASGDERITRIGRLLRRSKLDELPQLWNVLRGDMSLVGPRPEVPVYASRYRPEWEQLFDVRPGITDVASLAFRDEEELLASAADRDVAYRDVIMPLKLALSLEGIRQRTVLNDLRIIGRSVVAMLLRAQAPHPSVAEARRRISQMNGSRGTE